MALAMPAPPQPAIAVPVVKHREFPVVAERLGRQRAAV